MFLRLNKYEHYEGLIPARVRPGHLCRKQILMRSQFSYSHSFLIKLSDKFTPYLWDV